jgi:hypothetical protein
MLDFEGEAAPVSTDQLTGGAYKNKVINGAKLVTSLLTDEKTNIKMASDKKDINLLRKDIMNKINDINPSLEIELITNVQNGTADDAFINKLKYEVVPADLSKYCTLGTSYDVHLNYGHPLVSGAQTDFNKVLAHEFKHIDYGINNFYELIKWILIREASEDISKTMLFDLKDVYKGNGSCGCSAEGGHEKNNPENCTVCGEEKIF